MARNLITRTIKTTEATAMLVDTERGEVLNRCYTLSGTYKDEASALKAVAKNYNIGESERLVAIVDLEVKEQLYAIPEDVFLAHAKPVMR